MAEQQYPRLLQVVLDTTDARALAEFLSPAARRNNRVALQQVARLPRVTLPEGPIPQQLHLDLTVPNVEELEAQHKRALALGAQLLHNRSHDPEKPLGVYADPSGHVFCIFVTDY